MRGRHPGLFAQRAAKIVMRVGIHYAISPTTIMARNRVREVAIARWICFELLARIGGGPSEIARSFGMNHATVIYGLKEIRKMSEEHPDVRRSINALASLTSQHAAGRFVAAGGGL